MRSRARRLLPGWLSGMLGVIRPQQLAERIKGSPRDAGYASGSWNTPVIQDLFAPRRRSVGR
jgi:hypothetical protein